MNPNRDELRALLEDVLPATGEHCGPSRAHLLDVVKRERSRRHRTRTILVTTAACLFAALVFIWPRSHPTNAPLSAGPKAPTPIVIHEVNDQQLFALLKDTPVALVEWPNGERTLMIVEH